MIKRHAVAVCLALGSLAALPACSSMNPSPAPAQTSYAAPLARPEMSPSMVMQVQTTLQQQGFYKGNIDGLWGPATEGAVQSYQTSQGLAANGQLDQPTLAALNAPPPAAAAPPVTTSSAAPVPAPAPTSLAPAAPPVTTSSAAPIPPASPATP